jgi:opine dehydrogenase
MAFHPCASAVGVASRRVVVFGGDRAALVVAARLALAGHRVVWWASPSAGEQLPVSCEQPRVRLGGAGGEREATLTAATTDPFKALAAADVLLACAPPDGLGAIAELVLPLLEPRHTLVVLGGGLHALAAANWLRDRGRSDLPTLAGSDTVPVAGLGRDGDRFQVTAIADRMGFGVLPARRTQATMTVLGELFPGARAHANVAAAGLAAVEAMLCEAAALMNLGAVGRTRAGASLFEDGFSRQVAHVAEALDGERLALAAALGLDLPTSAEALRAWGFSPGGDLWAAVNGSFVLTQTPDRGGAQDCSRAAGVGFGMRAWVDLGDRLSVPMPVARSLAAIRTAAGFGRADCLWSLDDLGLAGRNADELQAFLAGGTDDRET